jgi:hypothetical protein
MAPGESGATAYSFKRTRLSLARKRHWLRGSESPWSWRVAGRVLWKERLEGEAKVVVERQLNNV